MALVADAIVRHLLDAGVGALFGVPGGGSNLDLIAAAGRAGLRFVLTATETSAAIAAIAQAEITDRPGACLTTLGPGVASVVNGVACASLDRAPLIVFTDAPPTAEPFAHQRLDHRALLAPVTKWSATISPATADAVMIEALARAMERPRGAVHVECPADVLAAASHQSSLVGQPAVASHESLIGGVASLIADLPLPGDVDRLLAESRRPLLLVGLGACDATAAAAVRALCASHRVRALVTYKAKGVVPDRDPHFAGVLTNGA